ncbi:hypothetical protein [Neorickettsia findlayensis]|uniref:Uncharacterized protein n=1 Tax=Neorickettsia findlayensis TaxID=2686014 RepID=A0A6P1G8Z1_9RICK|nr:hypothetical protein [Neorickettsia findlayensis]QHD64937.1 hypothetical protein GP480_00405 [Neorickettsia findlayensis]
MGTSEKIALGVGVVLGVLLLVAMLYCLHWLFRRRAALRAASEEESKQPAAKEPPVPRLEEVKVGTLAALESCISQDELFGQPDLAYGSLWSMEASWGTDVVIVDTEPRCSLLPSYGDTRLYRALGIRGRPIDKSKWTMINGVEIFCGSRGRTSRGRRWVLVHAVPSACYHTDSIENAAAARRHLGNFASVLSSGEFAEYVKGQVRRHWGPGCMPTVLVEPPFADHPVMRWHERVRHFVGYLAAQPGVDRRGILPHMNLPVKVCCGSKELQAAALEGVRDAVKERSQERSSQGVGGI